MTRAQAGDSAALESLLRAQYDLVFAVARRLTGNQSDAEDAAQNALIAIAKNIAKFDGRSQFSSWTYRIAVNASYDQMRRNKRHDADALPDDNRMPSATTDVDAQMDIASAIAKLPEEFRSVIVLREVGALDYQEIADTLQIPIGTVRSRLARARSNLVELLGGNYS